MVSENIPSGGVERAVPTTPRDRTDLSCREREIVLRASKGATDKEIADDLDLSVATLRTYWMRVREKLGAVNRTHAIALATVDRPAAEGDLRSRLVASLVRDRLSQWIWRSKNRQVMLDEHAGRLFCLPCDDRPLSVDRLLAHVWTPDRVRFERYLNQALDLRAMTPIELRVGTPGDYRSLVRTVNLTSLAAPDATVLLATTTIHTFG